MRRRTVLWWGLGAVGALVVGWGALPPAQRLFGKSLPRAPAGSITINAWVRLASDGSVTLFMPRLEMGQGVHTGLAMLLAEELDLPLERVRFETAPIDAVYNNLKVAADGLPFHPEERGNLAAVSEHLTTKIVRHVGMMVTGGSTSLRDLWAPLREAGAMARATLLAAAAREWGVTVESCQTEAGQVWHAEHGPKDYAALVASGAVAAVGVVKDFECKAPARFTLIGTSATRVDSLEKSTGAARFTADIREPGMGHVALALAPQRDAELEYHAADRVLQRPGVRAVLPVPPLAGSWPAIAVIGDDYWSAKRALEDLQPRWRLGSSAIFDDALIDNRLQEALQAEAKARRFRDRGNAQKILAEARSNGEAVLEAEYAVPFLAHGAMEPISCAVKLAADGRTAEVYAASQAPDVARRKAAEQLGLAEAAVSWHGQYAGGAFGRRFDNDFIAAACFLAKQRPGELLLVQWSREDDFRQDFYRPAARARLQATLDPRGQILAWQAHSAAQSIVAQSTRRLLGFAAPGPDKTTAEGAFDQPYDIPHHRVTHSEVELPIPVGFWRSVGHSHQAFYTETFIDELAERAGVDAVEFRARHLQNRPRHLAVLRRAAAAADWSSAPTVTADGARVARGIALNASFGSIVAQVVEASLDAKGELRVHRVVVAIDCGLAVNPRLIAQQMESAVVYALSAALYGELHFENGAVRESNFHDHPVLRLAECPDIETHLVASDGPLGGVGEPGVPPLAPALANALARLTGQRPRRLPLSGA